MSASLVGSEMCIRDRLLQQQLQQQQQRRRRANSSSSGLAVKRGAGVIEDDSPEAELKEEAVEDDGGP
eukprot:11776636-Alexandrium_andersonii.AAC.1